MYIVLICNTLTYTFIALVLVSCSMYPQRDVEIYDLEGVGVFHRQELDLGGSTSIIFECNKLLGESSVRFITYTYEGVSIHDVSYQERVKAIHNDVSDKLDKILIAASNEVKDLSFRYGGEYAGNWPSRISLEIVRIPFNGNIELSLSPKNVNGEQVLFHGLDLNLAFDGRWKLIKAWFDG